MWEICSGPRRLTLINSWVSHEALSLGLHTSDGRMVESTKRGHRRTTEAIYMAAHGGAAMWVGAGYLPDWAH